MQGEHVLRVKLKLAAIVHANGIHLTIVCWQGKDEHDYNEQCDNNPGYPDSFRPKTGQDYYLPFLSSLCDS